MGPIRLGILGTSEIAFRRFLPALSNCDDFTYMGVASRSLERADSFIESFGGRGYGSYEELLADPSIDAVYIPLPPALHNQWGQRALKAGKHILMEKPFTTSFEDTNLLLDMAAAQGYAVHENYMFQFHSQLSAIRRMVEEGKIGKIRLIRIAFGFPFRGENDFRYVEALGGGSLLDCGGYTIKLASLLLGESARLVASQSNYLEGFDVDIYGSATLINNEGMTAQVSFGMDNSYKCELELWGSNGTILTNRIFTAPVGYAPQVTVRQGDAEQVERLPADDTFAKSIMHFAQCITEKTVREKTSNAIRIQAKLMEDFIERKEK